MAIAKAMPAPQFVRRVALVVEWDVGCSFMGPLYPEMSCWSIQTELGRYVG